jgi:hypothetical protein
MDKLIGQIKLIFLLIFFYIFRFRVTYPTHLMLLLGLTVLAAAQRKSQLLGRRRGLRMRSWIGRRRGGFGWRRRRLGVDCGRARIVRKVMVSCGRLMWVREGRMITGF